VQAHRMLGVAEIFQGDNDAAAQEFRKLLQLQPDYRFDPLLDPPQVIDLFNGVLRAHEAEVANLEGKQREAARARQRDREECEKLRAGPTVIEKRFGRNSFLLNFVPFGAGQFQNGHRRKGWAFLAAQASLAAASVAALTTNFALYGFRPKRGCRHDFGAMPCPPQDIDHTDENRSRWLLRTQVATGAAFFAAVAWASSMPCTTSVLRPPWHRRLQARRPPACRTCCPSCWATHLAPVCTSVSDQKRRDCTPWRPCASTCLARA